MNVTVNFIVQCVNEKCNDNIDVFRFRDEMFYRINRSIGNSRQ